MHACLRSFVPALGLAIALIGCGTNTESQQQKTAPVGSASQTTSKLTRAEFLKTADAICAQLTKDNRDESRAFEASRKRYNETFDLADLKPAAAAFRDMAPSDEAELRRFDDLNPPVDMSEAVATFIKGWRRRIALRATLADAIEGEDGEQILGLIDALSESITRGRGQAEGLGLQKCLVAPS